MKTRTTLITGGTGGLGQDVVARFLARGDRVVVPWHSRDEADELRHRIESMSGDPLERLVLLEGDVTDPEWVEGLAHRLADDGGLDVLLNLVGGFTMGSLEDTAPSAWEKMVTLNARSVFLMTRAMARLLKASGRGRVVNMAAVPAVSGRGDGMAAYAASKAAVASLTSSLAREFKKDRVTVNAVAPSTIDTQANRKAMPDTDPARWVKPWEIASLMDYLTGDDAAVVTGNVIVVDR